MIRLATVDDIPAIQAFLARYWSDNHVFVTSQGLLRWQHQSTLDPERIQFVIAPSSDGSAMIDGLLGYIPTTQWDSGSGQSNMSPLDIWLAVWKVRDDLSAGGGLGLSLLSYLSQQLRPRTIGAIGVNPAVLPLYQALGYQTGELSHLYLTNPACSQFSLMQPAGWDEQERPITPSTTYRWSPMAWADSNSLIGELLSLFHLTDWPHKTAGYYLNRYGHHPVYQYRLLGWGEPSAPRLILVWRLATGEGATSMVRLVDWVGDSSAWAEATLGLKAWLAETPDIEGLDTYCDTLTAQPLLASGFSLAPTDRMITEVMVPNYFEPFVKCNVALPFVYKGLAPGAHYRMVKGDSDQDRPSIWHDTHLAPSC